MPIDTLTRILDRRPWLAHEGTFSYGFTRAVPVDAEEDIAIGERLVQAYRRACRDMPNRGAAPDLWTRLLDGWYGDFKALLVRGDARELTEYLRDLPRQPAAHGYFQGREGYETDEWVKIPLNSDARFFGLLQTDVTQLDTLQDVERQSMNDKIKTLGQRLLE